MEITMAVNRRWLRLAQVVAPVAVFLGVTGIGIFLGVEEKPLWERAWAFLAGGSLGAFAGLGFFLMVGAVGLVSGPLFGAIGVFGLIAGGALGGMGLGAIVDIVRNPGNYSYDTATIATALAIGVLASLALYVLLGRIIFRVEGAPLHNSSEKSDA